ncbi:MAG TPA: ribonuclease H-like domain-containing protein [Rhodocyclaceae bacterium]|nr:ribonuclease H-like domain-containing protein [Rhodocyclaceae bacterium]
MIFSETPRTIADPNRALVFKIVTVPDVAGLRLLHGLPAALADNEVVEFAYQKGRALADASNASDVLALYLQRVVSIACCMQDEQQFRAVSLVADDNDEAALIQRFFDLLEQERAQPVSWNGAHFDWPVLRSRSMVCGAVFAQENTGPYYLQSLLAAPSGGQSSLHELAGLCSFPRTPRLPDSQIWHAWRNGRADEVHMHCATEAVICHLLYLRWLMISDVLDATQYANRIQMIRDTLEAADAQPWREFLEDW